MEERRHGNVVRLETKSSVGLSNTMRCVDEQYLINYDARSGVFTCENRQLKKDTFCIHVTNVSYWMMFQVV